MLDIVNREASRESGGTGERRRSRDDFGAVDEVGDIVSEHGHLGKSDFE